MEKYLIKIHTYELVCFIYVTVLVVQERISYLSTFKYVVKMLKYRCKAKSIRP